MDSNYLLPGQTLGLLGGGQLGRMFAQAAAQLGYHVVVVEPSDSSPAAEVCAQSVNAAYDDLHALAQLSQSVRSFTTEFENVPAQSLEFLEAQGTLTSPSGASVRPVQNRNLEKAFIEKAQAPTAPHCAIRSLGDCDLVDSTLFPGILKTATLGYDGKGQVSVDSMQALKQAYIELGQVECILEKRLPLKLELSVLVARARDGSSVVYAPAENYHQNGILAYTIQTARISEALKQKAQTYAKAIAQALDYVGVLCVEMFVLENDDIVVNELAPRPHNSGHATIEACHTSQFEQQVRIMVGLPVGDPTQHSPAIMLNLLGDLWLDENNALREPNWMEVLRVPGVHLHLYGKKQARRARKMGHITVLADTLEETLARAQKVAHILHLPFTHLIK